MRCSVCVETYFDSRHHVCPPEWETRIASDNGEDWELIRARRPEVAAERAVELWDEDRGLAIAGEAVKVIVRRPGAPDEEVEYQVNASLEPLYTAVETRKVKGRE